MSVSFWLAIHVRKDMRKRKWSSHIGKDITLVMSDMESELSKWIASTRRCFSYFGFERGARIDEMRCCCASSSRCSTGLSKLGKILPKVPELKYKKIVQLKWIHQIDRILLTVLCVFWVWMRGKNWRNECYLCVGFHVVRLGKHESGHKMWSKTSLRTHMSYMNTQFTRSGWVLIFISQGLEFTLYETTNG